MSAAAMTWAMSGLRRSTRTNSTLPRSRAGGGTVSTPMTRVISGSAASTPANRAPIWRDTPVTSTVWAIDASQTPYRYFLLRRWTRVRLSSLRCFFFAIRLRRFLMTEPTGPPER